MKIVIEDNKNQFEQNLRNQINDVMNPIIFDITVAGKSRKILKSPVEGSFLLSYSRPLFINILNPPLADYEFVFSVESNKIAESITIIGKIRLKKYMIGAILLVLLLILYRIYNVIYFSDPFYIGFMIIMPSILCFLLIIEYFFFRKRVLNFIKGLTN